MINSETKKQILANRIDMLTKRDSVGNAAIISKCRRRLKNLSAGKSN